MRILAPYVLLQFDGKDWVSLSTGGSSHGSKVLRPEWLAIIEAFVHPRSTHATTVRDVFAAYQAANASGLRPETLSFLSTIQWQAKLEVVLRPGQFAVKSPVAVDLTRVSWQTLQILQGISAQFFGMQLPPAFRTFEEFDSQVSRMVEEGFLSPPVGTIDFGDLRRTSPLCRRFGLNRGLPIDRYYMLKFVQEIRAEVLGPTVDIGGIRSNKSTFGFDGATPYRAMDINVGDEIDIVGNVCDPSALPAGSVQSIIAFNLLEHIREPWKAIANMFTWLAPGGKVFVIVPVIQRVHRMPGDYWRLLPDALDVLFQSFPQRRLRAYGNVLTSAAALYGTSVKDVNPEELDVTDEDYPVVSCLVATK